MYVEKNVGNERIMRFSQIPNSKYQALRKLNGYQDLFFIYTRKAIESLIQKINKDSGICIYFARYTTCDYPHLPPAVEEGKVILLFATQSADSSAPKSYYFLNDKGVDDKNYEVSKVCGEAWIADYEKNVLPELSGTLIPNDADNIDPRKPGVYTDTKSIIFTVGMIKSAFIDEAGYEHKTQFNGVDTLLTISAYKLSFSDYGPKGNGGTGKQFYRQRLFIQFDYMFKYGDNNEVFYLDDMADFSRRSKPSKMMHQQTEKKLANKKKPMTKERAFTLDNGQLCPTHCPTKPPTGG